MKTASWHWKPFLVTCCLASVFATGDCTYDASQLRALPEAGGVAGSDGPTATGDAEESDAAAATGADGPAAAETADARSVENGASDIVDSVLDAPQFVQPDSSEDTGKDGAALVAGADAGNLDSGAVGGTDGGNGGASGTGGAGGNVGTSGIGGMSGTGGMTDAGVDAPLGGSGGIDAPLGASGGIGGTGGVTGSGGTTGGNPCAGQPDFTPCTAVTTPDRHYDICVEGTCVSPGCGDAICNVPGPHFPLADTDQRLCYDNSAQLACPASGNAFFGQDAQYGWDTLHSESERFARDTSAANQPVVTDNVTGLAWQGCPAGLSGNACNSGSAATFLWSDALVYCDGLNWGGEKDWHLPDPYELQSIVDLGTQNPAIDTTAFPATPSTTPSGAGHNVFWSSSSYAGNPSSAWYQSFFGGGVYSFDKSSAGYVRCVRSGRASGAARFSRNTSATDQPIVTDSVTGLSWQGCTAGLTGSDCVGGTVGTYTWANALGYCAGLSWGGLQDWHLPNAKELHSIVNDRRTGGPTIDVTAFPNTPANWFWSSSSSLGNPSYAWYVSLNNGNVDSPVKSGGYYVRCVRSGP